MTDLEERASQVISLWQQYNSNTTSPIDQANIIVWLNDTVAALDAALQAQLNS